MVHLQKIVRGRAPLRPLRLSPPPHGGAKTFTGILSPLVYHRMMDQFFRRFSAVAGGKNSRQMTV
jgi:hypothetical protein